jgi:dolichyl-phosphate-mannose-protein mannosyltransferase
MGKRKGGGRARGGMARGGPRKSAAGSLPRRDRVFDWGCAAGLTLLAWAHRLIFLRANRDFAWPYTFFYEGDSETFYRHARALLAGELYDSGLPFHPPGFPWLLAGVHALLGAGAGASRVPHAAVKTVLALLGSLAVGLLYLLARRYVGRTAALLGALLCVYHFGLYVLAIAPVGESLYLTLLTAALLLWSGLEHPLAAPEALPGGRGGAPRRGLALGLLLGALALTRAEGALVGGLLGGVGLLGALRRRGGDEAGRTRRERLLPWVLVAAGWILAVGPWTWRNAVRIADFNRRMSGQLAEPLPTFVPLTIYGPINLALANNPRARGSFSREGLTSAAGSPALDFTQPEHLRFVLHGDEMAWEWIRAHPGGFARLAARKWGLFLGAWRLGWTQWDWPGGLRGVRRPVDVFVPDSAAACWLGPPLALLGLALCLATPGGPRRWALLVLLLAAAGLATTALFFGYARLGLLLAPFGLVLAGAALAWLGRLAATRGAARAFHLEPGAPSGGPARRLLLALGLAAAALLALELHGVAEHRNFRATGTTAGGAGYLNPDDTVYLEPIP